MRKVEKPFTFRKTKDNGDLGGTTQHHSVPEFDWDEFKNIPNAELFARRAYNSLLQKIVRDILLDRNSTSESHLQSMESVIARSLTFTKKEIEEWCKSRDWSNTKFNVESSKAIQALTDKLPEYAVDDDAVFDVKTKKRIAEIVAGVADRKTDDIAEYLWVKLTEKSTFDELSKIDF